MVTTTATRNQQALYDKSARALAEDAVFYGNVWECHIPDTASS